MASLSAVAVTDVHLTFMYINPNWFWLVEEDTTACKLGGRWLYLREGCHWFVQLGGLVVAGIGWKVKLDWRTERRST